MWPITMHCHKAVLSGIFVSGTVEEFLTFCFCPPDQGLISDLNCPANVRLRIYIWLGVALLLSNLGSKLATIYSTVYKQISGTLFINIYPAHRTFRSRNRQPH